VTAASITRGGGVASVMAAPAVAASAVTAAVTASAIIAAVCRGLADRQIDANALCVGFAGLATAAAVVLAEFAVFEAGAAAA
jgi:hypothetical protein